MSSVVFILGAGASAQCGTPVMSNFLDVARNILRTNQAGDRADDFDRVFATIGELQAVHSKAQIDLNNIEAIFTALELGRIIRRVPGVLADDIPKVIASLKEVIVKTLEVTMKFPTEQREIGAPEAYKRFAQILQNILENDQIRHTVSVITFNYDVGLDVAMWRQGLGPDYVLSPAPRGERQVPLMKLHGSLNWAREKGEKKVIRPAHLMEYFRHYSINGYESRGQITLPIGSQLQQFFSKYGNTQVDREPVIVPPSWNKADYHEALSDVWAAAAKHLSEAERIFIIGYSLPETDSFFRHLYALGSTGKAPLQEIVVYDPDDSGHVELRFRSLLGPGAVARYSHERRIFAHAISSLQAKFPARR